MASARQRTVYVAFYAALAFSPFALVHFAVSGPREFLPELAPTADAGALLWQVHSTFLSVGFAGLAIATQIFTESPVAIGATRSDVLRHVRIPDFAKIGLASNLLIGAEALWLESDAGLLLVVLACLLPTAAAMVWSYWKMLSLLSSPTQLDARVQATLVETVEARLKSLEAVRAASATELESLRANGLVDGPTAPGMERVPVFLPHSDRVVRRIRSRVVQQAVQSAAAITSTVQDSEAKAQDIVRVEISANVELGTRQPSGRAAFWIFIQGTAPAGMVDGIKHILLDALDFEDLGAVTPDEEIAHELGLLRDTLSASLRSGQFNLAERALNMIEAIVRKAWQSPRQPGPISLRLSALRSDWLYRTIAEAELDASLGRRETDLFIDHAMSRTLTSPALASYEHFTLSLASFARIGRLLLEERPPHWPEAWHRLLNGLQNLAEYSFHGEADADDLRTECVWTIVELAKAAIDAENGEAALEAAAFLASIFEHIHGHLRREVGAGQLVLRAWTLLLASKGRADWAAWAALQQHLTLTGTYDSQVAARSHTERPSGGRGRWEWWELESDGPAKVTVMEMDSYIDKAVLKSMSASWGPLSPASDEQTASTYRRLLSLAEDTSMTTTPGLDGLIAALRKRIDEWKESQYVQLSQAPLAASRIAEMRESARAVLTGKNRLATLVPALTEIPELVQDDAPILGMNLRVPREYLVEEVFNSTYADPAQIGQSVGRGFIDGEDRKVCALLRSLNPSPEPLTPEALSSVLDQAAHTPERVLVAPFGGPNLDHWWTTEVQQALSQITLIESAALEDELLLFSPADFESLRQPEAKQGLTSIADTQVALGVFEDVTGMPRPHVRVESGEKFVVWPRPGAAVRYLHGTNTPTE